MSAPVPMPTARQAALQDRFTHYLSLEQDGPVLEALKAAKELVEEEGLNPYHAAHLHMKLAGIPEVGVHHARKAIEMYMKLKESDPSMEDMWHEAWKVLLERQNAEKDWKQYQNARLGQNGGTENDEAIRQQRYNEYFYKLEQEPQSSSGGMDLDERNPLFEYPAKKERTGDLGGEEEKEEEESNNLHEEDEPYLVMR